MRHIIKTLLGIASGAVLFASCTKEIENPADSNDYFPLQVGKFVLYNVDSTVYDPFNKLTIRNTYQMRYEIVDSFIDGASRINYTINVDRRVETDSPFVPTDVIQVAKTENGVEWTQSNAKILKLIFPVSDGSNWDGMTYIEPRQDGMEEYDKSIYDWNFYYSNVGVPFDPGNKYFEKTLTVNGIDESLNTDIDSSTVIANRNFYQEKYAAGIGMIYRERIFWEYQKSVGYKKGYELLMRAIDYN